MKAATGKAKETLLVHYDSRMGYPALSLECQPTVNHEGIIVLGASACTVGLGIANILQAGTQVHQI